jgi:H+/Cl- antiporter ClcA
VGHWLRLLLQGQDVAKATMLLEEYENPQKIPLTMAPLVLFGTLITHLLVAVRRDEGTAVQMGGTIADQFTMFSN